MQLHSVSVVLVWVPRSSHERLGGFFILPGRHSSSSALLRGVSGHAWECACVM